MVYMGSKRLLAKYILPLILGNRQKEQIYIEPFCGGLNSLLRVQGPRIASDICPYLIEMWIAVKEGWIPPKEITEEQYNEIKNNKDKDYVMTAYAGYFCSFGAKFFGGYARSSRGNPSTWAFNSSQKQFPLIKDSEINFYCSDYCDLDLPQNSIIYCDPPYAGTTKYRKNGFDSNKFWQWCRDKKREGHQIYISEYIAPIDFKKIWQKTGYKNLAGLTAPLHSIECLYTY